MKIEHMQTTSTGTTLYSVPTPSVTALQSTARQTPSSSDPAEMRTQTVEKTPKDLR